MCIRDSSQGGNSWTHNLHVHVHLTSIHTSAIAAIYMPWRTLLHCLLAACRSPWMRRGTKSDRPIRTWVHTVTHKPLRFCTRSAFYSEDEGGTNKEWGDLGGGGWGWGLDKGMFWSIYYIYHFNTLYFKGEGMMFWSVYYIYYFSTLYFKGEGMSCVAF